MSLSIEPQVRRPILRYHGGKWKLAPWIISHFPVHRVYVEPFGGAASVLLRKPRSYAEVYNDLDGSVVNVFRVIRERSEDLLRAIELTPFSREEYLAAWHPHEDPVESARRTIVRAFMGFGSSSVTAARAGANPGRGGLATTGFRGRNGHEGGSSVSTHWRNYPIGIPTYVERLRDVVIDNRSAEEVMLAHDSERTLHYVDPPYVGSTRDAGGDYRHEMTDDDHRALAATLKALRGSVVLSGYDCPLYADLYADWRRVERAAHADGARDRTEVLWMNFQGSDDLFAANPPTA